MDLTFDSLAVRRTAQLVHSLSKDLRRIESGIGLTIEDRIQAPRIEDWKVTYRLELALSGVVRGHPRLADGPVTTSGLFLLDEKNGYARTLSRYYILGRRQP